MSETRLSSPLMLKYQKTLEQNPRSRVFAPLAENYRQLGMLDKAIEVLKSGIRFNPNYVLGYLGMAFCYFDMRKFTLAYATLRPLVETNRDNIRLQNLFASVCEKIGYYPEALETYKYLLFVDPKNTKIAKAVEELEKKTGGEKAVFIPKKVEEKETLDTIFDAERINVGVESDIDDWVAIDFSAEVRQEEELDIVAPEEEEIEEEVFSEEEETEDIPVVTHTLVDIYCAQGHFEKAKDVLGKILELDPSDLKTQQKLEEVTMMIQKKSDDADEGHSDLMNIIDKKFGIRGEDQFEQIEKRFNQFHNLLKKRAQKSIS